MKTLICGASRIAFQLLKMLGDNWEITLLDLSQKRLDDFAARFSSISNTIQGDASSPVTLDEAKIEDFDYTLALTGKDESNLAIAGHARHKHVPYVLALVNDQENLYRFQELEVNTLSASTLLAKSLYHYLQDPRIKMIPLGLGQAEIMEIDIANHFRMIGRSVSAFMHGDWRVVGIFRDNQLLFPEPDMVIRAEDRLIIVGKSDVFRSVCTLLECGLPRFPKAYGQTMLITLNSDSEPRKVVKECMHLARDIQISHIKVVLAAQMEDARKELGEWSGFMDIKIEETDDPSLYLEKNASQGERYGLVGLGRVSSSFFTFVGHSPALSLASSLSSPVLITRFTYPYKRIIIPFNASPSSELALEVGIDLANQLHSDITVSIVEESSAIQGSEEGKRVDSVLERAREIAQIHKTGIKEEIYKGNPVREILAAAENYNLIIVGNNRQEKVFFTPRVGEYLAQKAPCSVLIVTN